MMPLSPAVAGERRVKRPPAQSADEAQLGVASDVGRLRRVIVHRPGLELKRVTPANKHELLFRDVMWLRRAREEHDAFVDALVDRGVDILYLGDLLADVLELAPARAEAIERTLTAAGVGASLEPEIASWLGSLSSLELSARLIGGVAYEELPPGMRRLAMHSEGFAVAPLPNHLFTRDASAWVFGGVGVHAMAEPARRREAVHFDVIYHHHPAFARPDHEIWTDGLGGAARLDGRDVLVIGRGCAVAGVNGRTTPEAVELLARRLFTAGAASHVLALPVPALHPHPHLDAALTMVDRDAFTVCPELLRASSGYSLRPEGVGVKIDPEPAPFATMTRVLDVDRLRLFETACSSHPGAGEQWEDGNGVLAIAPGTVLAYERNAATTARLRRDGIEVITIAGGELARGGRGPHSLACPVARDPVRPI